MKPDGRWRKSTRSNTNGACVEVRYTRDGAVEIRDTKNPQGGTLRVHPSVWAAFTHSVVTGGVGA